MFTNVVNETTLLQNHDQMDHNTITKKVCRICLEEEEDCENTVYHKNNKNKNSSSTRSHDDPMIVPCHCTGSRMYVHRSCLNQWRITEPNRAFVQCTECLYQYQFMNNNKNLQNSISSSSSFTNNKNCYNLPLSYMQFCYFVSRDICIVTVVLQLIICSLAYVIYLYDQNVLHNYLIHLFNARTNETYDDSRNDNSIDSTSIHHELGIYYFFGVISFLTIIGTIGCIIFCCNGCRVPYLKSNNTTNRYNRNSNANDDDDCCRCQDSHDDCCHDNNEDDCCTGCCYETHHHNHHNNHRHRESNNDCCHENNDDDCCGSNDNEDSCTCCCCCDNNHHYNHRRHRHYHHTTTGYSSNDCCDNDNSCCNEGERGSRRRRSRNDGDSNPCAVVLFIVLLVFTLLSMIGLLLLLMIGVIVCQRIVQRYIFLLHKKSLVHEYEVVDLSKSDICVEGDVNEMQSMLKPVVGQQQQHTSLLLSNLKTASTSYPHDVQHIQR